MTVVSVVPKYAGLSGKGSLDGVREYTKVYTVTTDSPSDGVMAVGNALGIPRKWEVYYWSGEVDAGALCWDVSPRPDPDNQLIWEVTCQYSTDMRGGEGGPLAGDPARDVDNPLLIPPEVTWDSWSEMKVVHKDRNGVSILNSAGLPFDPPLQRRYTGHQVTVVRNEAAFPTLLAQQYEDTVNSDAFYGWAPEQARLESLTANSQYTHNLPYWTVRYVIQFKTPDWSERIPDAGARYFKRDAANAIILNSDGTKKLYTTEDDGVYSTNVVYLNWDGTRMSQDDVIAGNIRHLKIDLFEPKPYAALNL